LAALVSVATDARTAEAQWPESWTEPYPPFRIAPNLYYVGSRGLANYLITTPSGHILINSDLEANVPLIRASVESLGFKFGDVRILLISHAHWDHNAGSALIKQLTGATYMVMDADVDVVESGGRADFQYGSDTGTHYPATRVDRVLHDGDEVKLGEAVLVAHLTPGHTKGTTTWTMKVTEGGTVRHVVMVGSPNVNPGYNLVNNPMYPQIAQDFERGLRVLQTLPCDYFLGAHGSYFDMEAKHARMRAGDTSAFIDPDGCQKFVVNREQAFHAEFARQRGASRSSATAGLRPEDTEVWTPIPPVVAPGPSGASPPPSDAVVLFGGADLNEWENVRDRAAARWSVGDGVFTVNKSVGDIQTKRRFRDYELHLEFRIPANISGDGQGRGNSGLYLAYPGGEAGGYELQILDSYENATYVNGMAGSVYKQAIPLANASRKPGEWQSYDVNWTAPRFDGDGSLKAPARVTVRFNGLLVQDDFALLGTTVHTGKPAYYAFDSAPIMLQAHGDPSPPISFRNVWVREQK